MPFPKNLDEMKAFGYRFADNGTCKGCGEDIEWWVTPRGKNIPMNPMQGGSSEAVSHFATCSDAPLFSKQPTQPQERKH